MKALGPRSCSRRRIPSARRGSSCSNRPSAVREVRTIRGRRARRNGVSVSLRCGKAGDNADSFAELLCEWAPSLAHDDAFKEWFVGHMRRSLSPGAALSFFRTMKDADVSDILSAVSVPTLLLCKPGQRPEAEYVAQRIAGSEIAELPGLDGLFTWVDDDVHEQTMRESERFLMRIGRPHEPDRVLATVLFTDIV